MPIPKIIHQTVKNKRKLHPVLQQNIAHLRALHPGWRHCLYDDKDIRVFIARNYDGKILRYFNLISPTYGPAKADFFRYLLLYKYGGVYLDAKSSVSRPLDEAVTRDKYLLSYWNNNLGQRYQGFGLHPELGPSGEFQQWHIVAPPEHPFLKAVIQAVMANMDRYDPDVHGTGKIGVLRLTGPIAYTQAIVPIRCDHVHEVVDAEQLGFVYSVTGAPGRELSHEALFPGHYRGSAEPILRKASVGL